MNQFISQSLVISLFTSFCFISDASQDGVITEYSSAEGITIRLLTSQNEFEIGRVDEIYRQGQYNLRVFKVPEFRNTMSGSIQKYPYFVADGWMHPMEYDFALTTGIYDLANRFIGTFLIMNLHDGWWRDRLSHVGLLPTKHFVRGAEYKNVFRVELLIDPDFKSLEQAAVRAVLELIFQRMDAPKIDGVYYEVAQGYGIHRELAESSGFTIGGVRKIPIEGYESFGVNNPEGKLTVDQVPHVNAEWGFLKRKGYFTKLGSRGSGVAGTACANFLKLY